MLIRFILLVAASLLIYFYERIHSRRHILSSLLLFITVLLAMGGNSENADTWIYMRRYQDATFHAEGSTQWAQQYFLFICNKLGFSFQQFRFIYYLIGLSLICITAYKVISSQPSFLLFYILFPMLIDATQMKNFMAMAILSFAIPFLLNAGWKNKLTYILLIFLAAGFQLAAYAYLPLILFANTTNKKSIRALAILLVAAFSLLFSNRFLGKYLPVFILQNLSETTVVRVQKFFYRQINLGYLVYFLATFIVFFFLRKIHRDMQTFEKAKASEKQFVELCYLCSIYSFAFFPFYLFASDFSRLLRNFSIINHIAVVLYIQALRREEKPTSYRGRDRALLIPTRSFFFVVAYLLYLAYMYYWDIAVFYDTVVVPFFTYNSIL